MTELDSVHHKLSEIELMLKILMPKDFTITYLSEKTGRSRQAITTWLERNAELDTDYWKKNGKIIISEQIAMQYLSKRVKA